MSLCIPVPLYHCFGLVLGNLACMTNGASIVYPSEGFDPEKTLQCISQEKCTGLHGVPTMFIAEMNHPNFSKYDLSTLRTGIIAGSLAPASVMSRIISEMHLSEITNGYGMTETSPVSLQTNTDDDQKKRCTTVGTIHEHLEVKVVDEQGKTLATGQKGELCTKGYSVMSGYWNNPTKTKECIDNDGFMHTGDLAVIDEEGYVAIVGRIKDIIIRGGENIYPGEIEDFLLTHPKVSQVSIVGVPDRVFGEQLCAWVNPRSGMSVTEQELRDYCKEKIAHFKIPKYWLFRDVFPMTVTGKIQKFAMRDQSVEILGLQNEMD